MRNYCKKNGFTLIELIVVIGIVAVTSIMAAYLIKSYEPDVRLYTASRELKSRLDKARSLTLTTQQRHGVIFDSTNNLYQLAKFTAVTEILETYELGNQIDFFSIAGFAGDTVSFNSAGAASQAGDIILANNENLQKNISVKPSGYVAVE